MIAAISRGLLAFQRNQRGQIGFLMLLVLLWLWLLVAVVWNTGTQASTKVQTQNAADTAAYAAALQMSRGLNYIAATNELILRQASARTLYVATPLTWGLISREWAYWQSRLPLIAIVNPPLASLIQFKLGLEYGIGANHVMEYLTTVVPREGTVAMWSYSYNRIADIHGMQRQAVDGFPQAVREQVEAVRQASGIAIHVTQPGVPGNGQEYRLPVKDPSFTERLGVYYLLSQRVAKDREGYTSRLDGMFGGGLLDPTSIFFGRGPEIWEGQTSILSIALLQTAAVDLSDDFYVLTTHVGPFETTPNDKERIDGFTMLAFATHPEPRGRYFLPGGFADPTSFSDGNVIALAQAETHNIKDSGAELTRMAREFAESLGASSTVHQGVAFMANAGRFFSGDFVPWRIWDVYDGMVWQPRLAPIDGLPRAGENDPRVIEMMESLGVSPEEVTGDRVRFMH